MNQNLNHEYLIDARETERGMGNLEGGVIELAIAKLPESVADFPFENTFSALEKLVQLLSNANLGATFFE